MAEVPPDMLIPTRDDVVTALDRIVEEQNGHHSARLFSLLRVAMEILKPTRGPAHLMTLAQAKKELHVPTLRRLLDELVADGVLVVAQQEEWAARNIYTYGVAPARDRRYYATAEQNAAWEQEKASAAEVRLQNRAQNYALKMLLERHSLEYMSLMDQFLKDQAAR